MSIFDRYIDFYGKTWGYLNWSDSSSKGERLRLVFFRLMKCTLFHIFIKYFYQICVSGCYSFCLIFKTKYLNSLLISLIVNLTLCDSMLCDVFFLLAVAIVFSRFSILKVFVSIPFWNIFHNCFLKVKGCLNIGKWETLTFVLPIFLSFVM